LGQEKVAHSGSNVHSLKELAVEAGRLQKHEQAIELWNRVATLQPNSIEAHVNLGAIYIKMQRHEEAATALRKALDLDPNSRDAMLNYALVEFKRGNINSSISALERLRVQGSENPLALGLLSIGYLINDEPERAVPFVAKLKKMGFNYVEYIRNSANDLISMGREEQANKLLRMNWKEGISENLSGQFSLV
jgi:tetratricopeptide (TPR) repeat protein